ncbi:hypothetical protein Trco_003311 [Trichoderma cornu-damae]|uniref:Uncharacterized protein n=1 Tax=Trichoderma cornu-damae TaxID=654480 RepID=A0A9P8QPF5_9HYPO|nr:hypothetical protein Trco_003311 [Trichoderma cornu-damae]
MPGLTVTTVLKSVAVLITTPVVKQGGSPVGFKREDVNDGDLDIYVSTRGNDCGAAVIVGWGRKELAVRFGGLLAKVTVSTPELAKLSTTGTVSTLGFRFDEISAGTAVPELNFGKFSTEVTISTLGLDRLPAEVAVVVLGFAGFSATVTASTLGVDGFSTMVTVLMFDSAVAKTVWDTFG